MGASWAPRPCPAHTHHLLLSVFPNYSLFFQDISLSVKHISPWSESVWCFSLRFKLVQQTEGRSSPLKPHQGPQGLQLHFCRAAAGLGQESPLCGHTWGFCPPHGRGTLSSQGPQSLEVARWGWGHLHRGSQPPKSLAPPKVLRFCSPIIFCNYILKCH